MSQLAEFLRLVRRPCEDMTALISASLDHKLPWSQRWAYKVHIRYCQFCRRYLHQLHFLRAALRTISTRLQADEDVPGPELSSAARARIARRLRAP